MPSLQIVKVVKAPNVKNKKPSTTVGGIEKKRQITPETSKKKQTIQPKKKQTIQQPQQDKKKIVKKTNQLTLGAFFSAKKPTPEPAPGASSSTALNVSSPIKSQLSCCSRLSQKGSLTIERKSQLLDIVLGRRSISRSDQTPWETPNAKPPKPDSSVIICDSADKKDETKENIDEPNIQTQGTNDNGVELAHDNDDTEESSTTGLSECNNAPIAKLTKGSPKNDEVGETNEASGELVEMEVESANSAENDEVGEKIEASDKVVETEVDSKKLPENDEVGEKMGAGEVVEMEVDSKKLPENDEVREKNEASDEAIEIQVESENSPENDKVGEKNEASDEVVETQVELENSPENDKVGEKNVASDQVVEIQVELANSTENGKVGGKNEASEVVEMEVDSKNVPKINEVGEKNEASDEVVKIQVESENLPKNDKVGERNDASDQVVEIQVELENSTENDKVGERNDASDQVVEIQVELENSTENDKVGGKNEASDGVVEMEVESENSLENGEVVEHKDASDEVLDVEVESENHESTATPTSGITPISASEVDKAKSNIETEAKNSVKDVVTRSKKETTDANKQRGATINDEGTKSNETAETAPVIGISMEDAGTDGSLQKCHRRVSVDRKCKSIATEMKVDSRKTCKLQNISAKEKSEANTKNLAARNPFTIAKMAARKSKPSQAGVMSSTFILSSTFPSAEEKNPTQKDDCLKNLESSKHENTNAKKCIREPLASKRANNVPKEDSSEKAQVELSEDAKSTLSKHHNMRQTYCSRAKEILEKSRDESFLKIDQYEIEAPQKEETDLNGTDFPDFAVPSLAALIEGKSDSLTQLATRAVNTLHSMYSNSRDFISVESTAAKMKLIATRKNYIKNPWIISEKSILQGQSGAIEVFEDTNEDFMWRWEVTLMDLLPEEAIAKVKKARSARRKIAYHFNAVARLLTALDDADKHIGQGIPAKSKLDGLLAKVSQEEEKVLKYEREEEKARLGEEAKRAKEASREKDQQEKQQQAEERRKEKERKKQEEKDRKEEAKRQKAMEREEAEKKELAQKQAELAKQKKCMMSFFTNAKPSSTKVVEKAVTTAMPVSAAAQKTPSPVSGFKFDVEAFRSAIDAQDSTVQPGQTLFPQLSRSAKLSRRKRTKRTSMPVFVTVYPDNPFAAQPYAERQIIEITNKFKFFLFHEDVRPPYHGTWSKSSSVVTGKNPFGKDSSYIDYDNDSEAEWEEGDDDLGEDLGDDKKDEEEDKDMEEVDEDNEDGWLADDNEVEEELDEETKLLRRQKIENSDQREALTVSVIAPLNGAPPHRNDQSGEKVVEGFVSVDAAMDFLQQHTVSDLHEHDMYLDAFPPPLIDEFEMATADNNGQALSDDELRCVAKLIHNSTLGSRDKLVEELVTGSDSVAKSRAQAYRILDSIAEKKKDPLKGIFWEVKKEVLQNLGLNDLSNQTPGAKQEAMRVFALFFHNSTCSSKAKVVDDFRLKYDSITGSRAEAMRIFEQISVKKKHPVSGIYWQVKDDVRKDFGLNDLPDEPPVLPSVAVESTSEETESQNKTASPKPSSDPNSASSDERKDSLSGKKRSSEEKTSSVGSTKILLNFLKKQRTN